jgi:hypothetical protein
MALMLGKLYDALRAGQIPDDKAREAAEEVAGYETRLAGIETRLSALTALLSINTAILIGLVASQMALWSRLGELAHALAH